MIGVDGQTVMIKHGARCVNVHSCRVRHENSEFEKIGRKEKIESNNKVVGKRVDSNVESSTRNEDYESDDDDDWDNKETEEVVNEGTDENILNDDRNEIYENDGDTTEVDINERINRHILNNDCNESDEMFGNDASEIEGSLDDESNENNEEGANLEGVNDRVISRNEVESNTSADAVNQKNTWEQARLYSAVINPTIKSTVRFKLNGSDTWNVGEVISRGGKATGKYRNWFNIRNVDNDQVEAVDWKEKVESWHPINVEPVLLTGTKLEDLEVQEAKAKELLSWKEHAVYSEVVDEGQETISTRWVCTTKETDSGKAYKARLVV